MRTEERRKWAQTIAERLFHEWAALPDYEPLDEDLALNLIVKIRDSLIEREKDWSGFAEHLLAVEALTPGGSNEGWAKRLLSGQS